MRSRRAGHVVAMFALLLGGCATVPRDPATRAQFEANNDPLEPLNRKTFAFNEFVDRILIKPLAKGYRAVLPGPVRDGIRHFLDNLNEPVVAANDLLQGRGKAALITAGRFAVNSSVGIAGFRDVAKHNRLPQQSGDFGQTLSVWGFHEGPYLMLPVLGPSSPRDGIGYGVDIYMDPFRYVARENNYPSAVTVSRAALDGVDQRERSIEALDEMRHEAVDYYASFRSLFRQHRAAELQVGSKAATPSTPPPNFYDDPGAK